MRFVEPKAPVVANVTARPVPGPGEFAGLLVAQVTGRVRWRESVDWMARNGVERFVEAGAGKVLTGMVKRIAPDAQACARISPAEIEDFANSL